MLTLSLVAGLTTVVCAQNPITAVYTPTPGETPPPMEALARSVNKNVAKFSFTDPENTYDFGKIPLGPVAEHIFEFKNVGIEPLIITNGQASCGCTSPEWPKEPIMPGQKGRVVVKYTTQGHVGPFTKSVYLTSNAPTENGADRYELFIKGEVVDNAKPTDPAKK